MLSVLRLIRSSVDVRWSSEKIDTIDTEHINDFFPMVATFKMLVYGTLFIRPAVLFSTVEECRFCLPNVCFGAARTSIAIDKTRVAEEWDSILI